MVKTLSDICLTVVASRINEFKDLDGRLTREQKETLIQRMCTHRQFDSPRLPFISKFLLSSLLRSLSLARSEQITDSILEQLAASGCMLRSLVIEKCKHVTDVGIGFLLRHQEELEKLTIRSQHGFTGHCFQYLHASKLKIVDLKHCDTFISAGLSCLTKNCQNVQSLNLSLCFKVDSSGIISMAENLMGKLEVLKMSSVTGVKDDAILALAENCRNLKVLKLYGCSGLSSEAMAKVFNNCRIGILDISYCYNIVQNLQTVPSAMSSTLNKMVLRGVQLTKEMLIGLCGACQNLMSLEACGVTSVDDGTIAEIIDARGETLRELDLSWCRPITDASLQTIIKGCPRLESVSVGYCENITGEPLKLLGKSSYAKVAKSLKDLKLAACRQADATIFEDFIPACSSLQELNVAGLKGMNDHCLHLLSRYCPQLKTLNVKGCQEITDAGVCELAVSCPIEGLVLSGIHQLTDRTIFALASTVTSTLEYIYLSGCAQISPHTVRYLQDVCIKGIHVEHRTPNAAPQQLMAKNLDTGEFCRADLMF